MALPVRPPSAAAARSRVQKPSGRRIVVGLAPVPRQEYPGERDVLVLADVAELVVGGRSRCGGPRRAASADRPRASCTAPDRGDRPHVRGEVGVVERRRLRRVRLSAPSRSSVGPPEPGHGDPPAVGMLRQPARLAEFADSLQVRAAASRSLRSMSTARQRRRACRRRPAARARRPADSSAASAGRWHRIAEIARAIRMSAIAREQPSTSVRASGPLEAAAASAHHVVRGVEIGPSPVGEAQQTGGRSAPQMVGSREVQRRAGVGHGGGEVAGQQGESGAVHRDRAGQPAEAPRRRPPSARPPRPRGGGSSQRSMSSSSASTPAISPLTMSAPTSPMLRTGRVGKTSSGSASSQRRAVASCRVWQHRARPARSGRPPARRRGRPARGRSASAGSPLRSYQSLARRWSSGTSSGCSSSRRARSTSANRWW